MHLNWLLLLDGIVLEWSGTGNIVSEENSLEIFFFFSENIKYTKLNQLTWYSI